MPVETLIPSVGKMTSVYMNGKVPAPAAGTAIVTSPNLSTGTWEIVIHSFIGGTTVANEADNMELVAGGTVLGRIINSVAGTSGGGSVNKTKFRFDGSGTILIRANFAATAGSVYTAVVIATRIN